MATSKELDFLSRFLNAQPEEEDVGMSRMDEEQLMDLRNINAETPKNPEAPLTDEEVQVAAANNEVEAFNAPKGVDRQVASEVKSPEIPSKQEPKLSTQEQLLQQLKELQEGRSESLKEARARDDKQRMVQSIIGAIPALYSGAAAQESGVFAAPTKISTPKPTAEQRAKEDAESRFENMLAQYKLISEGKKGQIDPYKKGMLDLKREELELKKQKQEGKAPEATFEEKERIKAEIKQKLTDEKEKREQLEKTKESIQNVDEQLDKVKRAKKLMVELAKKGKIADTGPLDQYITGLTDEGQELRQAFNDLSLDKMTKMFQGMSKAIDSDAERKMFEQSQASLSNYPSVNMKVLDNMEKALKSAKQKNLRFLQEDIAEIGPPIEEEAGPYGEEVVRNGKTYKWNPSAKVYQLKE